MELTMTNNFGFCELNENEMMAVEGGLIGGLILGAVVGYVGGCVVDGALKSFTGKTGSEWVSYGIDTIRGWF